MVIFNWKKICTYKKETIWISGYRNNRDRGKERESEKEKERERTREMHGDPERNKTMYREERDYGDCGIERQQRETTKRDDKERRQRDRDRKIEKKKERKGMMVILREL